MEAGPCVVVKLKSLQKDGYEAVQVGFGDIRKKLVNKPVTGQFAKAGVDVKRYLREFRFENAADYQIAQREDGSLRILGEELAKEQYGVGFKLGNTALRDQVQKTLDEMVADGTFEQITTKWNMNDKVCLVK